MRYNLALIQEPFAISKVNRAKYVKNLLLISPFHSHHPGLRPAAKLICKWVAWATILFNAPIETSCKFCSLLVLETQNTHRLSLAVLTQVGSNSHTAMLWPSVFYFPSHPPKQSGTRGKLFSHTIFPRGFTPFLPDSARQIIVRFACFFV